MSINPRGIHAIKRHQQCYENNRDTRKYKNRLQSVVAVALMGYRWFFVVRIEERGQGAVGTYRTICTG
jgi:hypothetical protein